MFSRHSLNDRLQEIVTADLVKAVYELPLDQLKSHSVDQLADILIPKLEVRPIRLKSLGRTLRIRETQLTEEGKYNRFDSPFRHVNVSHPPYIIGLEMTLRIPFDGDDWILDYIADPEIPENPKGRFERGTLLLELSLPHDSNPYEYKAFVNQQMSLIEKHVAASTEQVNEFNGKLPGEVRKAVKLRRKILSNREIISSILGVPLSD